MKNSSLIKILIVTTLLAFLLLSLGACRKKNPDPDPDPTPTPDVQPDPPAAEKAKVNVNFVNWDGSILYVTQVEAGGVAEYIGNTPTRTGTKDTDYVFDGWEYNGIVFKTIPAVNKDTVFRASFKESVRKYTVTFSVNGEKLTAEFEYGQTPVYRGETYFVINGDIYKISGWSSEFAPVTQNVTYTARLTLVQEGADGVALITFKVDEDSITEMVNVGTVPFFYGTPYRQERAECRYEFVGWSDGDTVYTPESLPAASNSVTYYAVFETIYKSFKVSFNVEGETVYQTEVIYGRSPDYDGSLFVKASDEKYDYSLSGWSLYDENYGLSLPAIYRDVTFEARFDKVVRNYLLTVNYYSNGQPVNSYYQKFSYGDSYHIQSPEISGYKPDAAYLSGIVTKDTVLTVEYSAYDDWNGGASSSFTGLGTKSSPYKIGSAEDLARLAAEVNRGNSFSGKYFEMTGSIDLSNTPWTAIGSYSNRFDGIFDGKGYAIHNLNYSSSVENSDANSGHGLFSTVTGAVKNLSVYGSVSSVAKYTGMVVGNLVGGEVSGCRAYGSVSGFGNVGGVVGLNSGSVFDCVNYALVTDNGSSGCYRFGGVVGTATTNGSVSDCVNNGTVRVSKGSGYVGGVVGYKENNATITDCSNYGAVSNTLTYTGGVIGYAVGQSADFTGLYNYAPISGAKHTAGIVGYNKQTAIKNSDNYGYVKGTTYVAGIASYSEANTENCLNLGNITGTASYVAGVVGSTNGSIASCVNRGDVYTKSSTVGGVVANVTANKSLGKANTVTDCENYGHIKVESTTANANVGGIVGKSAKATLDDGSYLKPVIENCVNYGTVFSNANYTGGVIGGSDGSVVRGCDNHGSVFSGLGTYVGGIAGSNWGYGLVTGCTNYGAVLGGSSVGEICGQLTNTSSAVGNTSNGKLI